MKRHEQQLDRFIDALNAGHRPPAHRGQDPELASLFATARAVRGLRPYLQGSSQTPHPPRRDTWRAVSSALLAVALLITVGVLLDLARAPTAEGGVGGFRIPAAPAWAGRPTPTPSPASAWTAEMRPTGAHEVGGVVLLRPIGTEGFRADVTLYGTQQPVQYPLTVSLSRGSCATLDAPSPGDILQSAIMHTTRVRLLVQDSWLDGPLTIVARQGTDGPQLACADLPVAARERKPIAGAGPVVGAIRPASGWHVGGQAEVWATPSGDDLLHVAVTGPEEELQRARGGSNLLWFVYRGSCATVLLPPAAGGGTVLYKENPGSDVPGQQDFTLVLERQWGGGPFAVAAFAEGGGPLITCGDLLSLVSP